MARRRFTVRDIAEILEHWQAGRSICAISRSLGVCRATVRKYVYAAEARGYRQGDPTPAQGWKAFLREVIPKPPDPSTRSETFARLLPYQDEIREALVTTTAATIWQRLRDDKRVMVSQPSFYRYLSCFLTDVWKKPRITVRRDDPPPGEEAQIDFGYLGMWQDPKTGKRYRLWAFALILSFSRHMFVRVVTRMDQREWLTCHSLAFQFLGGSPRRIVPDNLKTGIIKPDLYDPKFNQGYEELAHHYGVIIDPARSGKPKDKPRVERVIPYIRDSFWSGRGFTSLEEINRQATEWCLRLAGMREHGTTHQQPLALFRLAEQKELKPLPPAPFEMVTWSQAKVAPDCHIQVNGTLYSIPYSYVGKTVDVRLGTKVVEVYLDHELIKTHPKGAKGQRVTDWNDYPPEKAAFFQRTPDWYRSTSNLVGTSTGETVGALLEEHAFHHLRQCQGILRLADKYGRERLEQACARANAFGDPCYRTVKTILERELDKEPVLFEPLRPAGAFLHGPDELFCSIKS
ncbi:MAG: IS21 family transposase [Chloroflexi bacterium]|nr:IS21 family transposase [Chloroflexota bacterium]